MATSLRRAPAVPAVCTDIFHAALQALRATSRCAFAIDLALATGFASALKSIAARIQTATTNAQTHSPATQYQT
jgi:hypothetical protein